MKSTARQLASARRLAEQEPVKVLQAFYQVQEEEAARKKKEEYLEKYYATVKVLDKQVAEARAAKKKQEEDDLAAVRAELARTESMARAQKEAEDKRRQARVLEFKEREIERARVMKEKQRRKEEEMRREQEEVWAQAPGAPYGGELTDGVASRWCADCCFCVWRAPRWHCSWRSSSNSASEPRQKRNAAKWRNAKPYERCVGLAVRNEPCPL